MERSGRSVRGGLGTRPWLGLPMSKSSQIPIAVPSDWASLRGPGSGLTGLSGRIRLQVAGTDVGVLKVAGGAAEIAPDGEADATVNAETLPTLVGLLAGEVHPIVARLQNRVSADGDGALIVRVFLGLQGDSPWSGLRTGS